MKAPADRYPTADAVAVDLERWLAGDEIAPLPKPRRRWAWAAAALAAVAVVVVVVASSGGNPNGVTATNEPPPDADPLAPRTFIGENGLPSYTPHPRHPGVVKADPDGFCSIDTARLTLIELGKGPFPVAATIEADVAFVHGSRLARAGLYHAHRETTNGGKSYDAMFAMSVEFTDMEIGSPTWRQRAVFDAMLIRPNPIAPTGRQQIGRPVYFETPARRQGTPPSWVPLRVRIEKQAMSATAAGKELGKAAAADGRVALDQATRHDVRDWEFPGDAHADGGFGLFVEAGQFLFRRVRLVPDRPH